MYERKVYKKRTNGNIIKVTMNEFRNQVYVHIREYGTDGDTGLLFPTKSGYALLAEELDSVISALQESSELYALYSRYKEHEAQLEFEFE